MIAQDNNAGGIVQAIQRNAVVQRHDAVPALTRPVGSGAHADAADVAFGEEGRGEDGGRC